MTDAELLALHRDIVSIPSVSRDEGALCTFLEAFLRALGVRVERLGNNLLGEAGPEAGPSLCLCSHLDTVPAAPEWTRPPHPASSEAGRVYGLGSNDAKASVAAMIAAFLRLSAGPLASRLLLMLVCEEETGGGGAEQVLPELRKRGRLPNAALIGEPTSLDLGVAQKGLLVLELTARGTACHAAHRRALGVENALSVLARDLVAVETVDLGEDHPLLGPVTSEPTVIHAGAARNAVPGEASGVLDLRMNPGADPRVLVERLRAAVRSEVKVLSDRLRPLELDPGHPLCQAAAEARPDARLLGSRGLSDQVFFFEAGIPALKVGPGNTERSHTADEYVLESEILEGARFYRTFAEIWSRRGFGTGVSVSEGRSS